MSEFNQTIIELIGADKWNEIEGSIADHVMESPSVEQLQQNVIDNIFSQIWETGDLQSDFPNIEGDAHDMLQETVYLDVERQVKGA